MTPECYLRVEKTMRPGGERFRLQQQVQSWAAAT